MKPLLFRPSALALAVSTVLTAPLVLADDAKTDEPVEVIVVTAAATQTTLQDAPASISVVTREELEKMPVRDLTDILGTVEGVTISNSGNSRYVQVRGLDSAYVLKLIDGRRVDTTSSVFRGNDYDTGWVPVEAVERIEVVRGPMSSLYGSDAIGGVINVITRKGTDFWKGSVSADYTLHEHSDEGDSGKLGFYAGGPLIKDVLGLKVYGSADKRDADSDDRNGSGQSGVAKHRNKSFNADLSWTPDQQQDMLFGYEFSDREHDGQDISRNALFVSHKGMWDFGTTELKAYGDEIKNDSGNITGESHPNKSTNYNLEGLLTTPFDFLNQTLSVGGEYRYQELKDPDNIGLFTDVSTSIDVDQYALFLEDQISLTDDLLLTLGNRFDDHENFGSHNSPRAYMLWHATDVVSLRVGYAEAFRAPTLLQNSPSWGSVSCGSATSGCYIVGNEDLKPETSESWEVGASVDFTRWHASVTLFSTDLKNMIDVSSRTKDATAAASYPNFVGYLDDGRPVFEYQNLYKVTTRGVESSFDATLMTGLDLKGTYTFLDAKNKSYDVDVPLTYRPRHSGTLSLDWAAMDDLTISASGHFYGKQYLSVSTSTGVGVKKAGYATYDLGASYDWGDSTTIRGGVQNLTDVNDDRMTSTDFNIDGRRYFLSLTQRF